MINGAFVSSGPATKRKKLRSWIITNKRKIMDKILSPIHPGEVLLEDFMKPLGLSQYRLAHDIGVTPIRISRIVNGERSISVDTAMRLARYFGTSAAIWLRLQVRYDLEVAESKLGDKINREVKVQAQTPNPL
jgi:antitoxin HigA-1